MWIHLTLSRLKLFILATTNLPLSVQQKLSLVLRYNIITSSIRISYVFNIVRIWEDNHSISSPFLWSGASPSAQVDSAVYSQPLCLQAESLITVPSLLPRLHSSPPRSCSSSQRPWCLLAPLLLLDLVVMSGRVWQIVTAHKLNLMISHSQMFMPVCHISSLLACTQIYYLWSPLELGQLQKNVCAWLYVSECVKFMFILCIFFFFFTSRVNQSITQIQMCKSVTLIHRCKG